MGSSAPCLTGSSLLGYGPIGQEPSLHSISQVEAVLGSFQNHLFLLGINYLPTSTHTAGSPYFTFFFHSRKAFASQQSLEMPALLHVASILKRHWEQGAVPTCHHMHSSLWSGSSLTSVVTMWEGGHKQLFSKGRTQTCENEDSRDGVLLHSY